MTRGRPWPRTSSADYKSSRSIQFQPVRDAEKSRRYSRAGISYQLGTGFRGGVGGGGGGGGDVDGGGLFFLSFFLSLSLFLVSRRILFLSFIQLAA